MSPLHCDKCGRELSESQVDLREGPLCPECASRRDDDDFLDLTAQSVGEQDTDILPVIEQEINEAKRRKAPGQDIRERVEVENNRNVPPDPDIPGLDPRLPLGLKPVTFFILLFLALLLVVAAAYYLTMG